MSLLKHKSAKAEMKLDTEEKLENVAQAVPAPTHTARVLVTANAKGRDLMNDGVVTVASLGTDPELRHAIVKRVSTSAWNNPIGATVLVSAQLAGNSAAPISSSARNELGWLEHDSKSFSARPS